MAYVPVSAPSPWGAFAGGGGGGNFVQAMQMMMGLRKEREAREHREEMASLCKGLDMSSAHDLGICADKMRDHGEMDTARWMASQAIQRSQIEQQVASRALRREEVQNTEDWRAYQRQLEEERRTAPPHPDREPIAHALMRERDRVGGPLSPDVVDDIVQRRGVPDLPGLSADEYHRGMGTPEEREAHIANVAARREAGRAARGGGAGGGLPEALRSPAALQFLGEDYETLLRLEPEDRESAWRSAVAEDHPCADALKPLLPNKRDDELMKRATKYVFDALSFVEEGTDQDRMDNLSKYQAVADQLPWAERSYFDTRLGIQPPRSPCAPPPPDPEDPTGGTGGGPPIDLDAAGSGSFAQGAPTHPLAQLLAGGQAHFFDPSAPGVSPISPSSPGGGGMDAALLGRAQGPPTIDLMQAYRDQSMSPFLRMLTGTSPDILQRVPGGVMGR